MEMDKPSETEESAAQSPSSSSVTGSTAKKRPHNRPSGKGGKKRTSAWWDHFIDCKDEKGIAYAKCKHCPQVQDYSKPINALLGTEKGLYKNDGSTGNFKYHMENHHLNKYCILPGNMQPRLPDGQVTLNPKNVTAASKAPFKFDQEYSVSKLVPLVVVRNHPYTMVEEDEFRGFTGSLRPELKCPSAATLKSRVLQTYIVRKGEIRLYFRSRKIGLVSATTDLWTVPNHFAIISVTLTWFDENFKLWDVVIGFRKIEGSHSGENINKAFMEILKEYGIEEQILCVTTDNTSSNSTFTTCLANSAGISFEMGNWIRCFAHVINLAVQSALASIKVLLQKLRDLIKGILSSPQRLQKFRNSLLSPRDVEDENGEMVPVDGQSYLAPILDVPTSWSSTCDMTGRARTIRPGLDDVAALDKDLRKHEISDHEWRIIKEVDEFLEPFSAVTKEMEGSKYPTLSAVIPLHNSLLDHVMAWAEDKSHCKETVEGANAAKKKLTEYYCKTTEMQVVSVMLDPRLKMDYFIDQEWSNIETEIMPMMQKAWAKYKVLDVETVENDQTGQPTGNSSQSSSSGASFTNKIYRKSNEKRRTITDELETYLALGVEHVDGADGVADYWRVNSKKWPRLARVAQDYLAPPASSASSERSFSSGRALIGLFRQSMRPATMEMSICLRSWILSGLVKPEGVTKQSHPSIEEISQCDEEDEESGESFIVEPLAVTVEPIELNVAETEM